MADASAFVSGGGGGIGGDDRGFRLVESFIDLVRLRWAWITIFLVGAKKLEGACGLGFRHGGIRPVCRSEGLCAAPRFFAGSGGGGGGYGDSAGLDGGATHRKDLGKWEESIGKRAGGNLDRGGSGLGESERKGFIAGGSST